MPSKDSSFTYGGTLQGAGAGVRVGIRDIPKCRVSILQEGGKKPIPAAIESAITPETQHRLPPDSAEKSSGGGGGETKKAQCTVPPACVQSQSEVCVRVCVCVCV